MLLLNPTVAMPSAKCNQHWTSAAKLGNFPRHRFGWAQEGKHGGDAMASMTVQRSENFRIGKVFGDTFSVIGRNLGLWVGLAVLFSALPTLILQFLILQPMLGVALTDPNVAMTDPGMVAKTATVSMASGLVFLVLSALLQSSLIRATIEDLNGKRPSMGDCIGTAVSVLLPAIGLSLLIGIGVGIGFVLLIVPGIILLLRWCVAVPVLVQERQGVLGSMGRSAALTKGSRWALLGLFLILIVAAIVIQWVAGLIVLAVGATLGLVLSSLVQSVVSMVVSTASAVSYVELRQVKEGTSISELAEIFS
jgi:hypothetical protein